MIVMITYGPYFYDEDTMKTELGKKFLDLYDMLTKFEAEENEPMCEVMLHGMAVFLKQHRDEPQLLDECIQYLNDMPGNWVARLLLHILNSTTY